MLGKQVGWDRLEHALAVGKEPKLTENGSHEISGREWIRAWRSQNVRVCGASGSKGVTDFQPPGSWKTELSS